MTKLLRPILCALAISLVAITAYSQTSGVNLTLSWNAVTTDANGNPLPTGSSVTYNVYGAAQGLPLALLANVSTLSDVRTNVNVGALCYAVSAVLVTPATTAAVEGAQTAPVCTTVSPPPPAVPTNLAIQQTKP